MKIGIIGAGATGLSAAYELSKNGHAVVVLEQEPFSGGLAGSFRVGSQCVERFYHHIFTSDAALIALSAELGLAARWQWLTPKNGFYINDRLYPFTTPVDLLRFGELRLRERIALGSLVYRARFIKDWRMLEEQTAKEWLIRTAGEAVYAKVWGPLLDFKFGSDAAQVSAAWLWNKLKLRGSTRRKGLRREVLGYFEGGFQPLYRALERAIRERGGVIRLSTPVRRLAVNDDASIGLSGENFEADFDRVVVTTAPAELLRFAPQLPAAYRNQLAKIRYQANLCLILEMTQPLSDYYWISVAQPELPFVAVIEHTNLVGPAAYGAHLVYLSRYLDGNARLFRASDAQIAAEFCQGLQSIFPRWNPATVRRCHVMRARYSQPVVSTHYSQIRPGLETPLSGVYLATMAQIYPEDRGQNYAIEMGQAVARLVAGS